MRWTNIFLFIVLLSFSVCSVCAETNSSDFSGVRGSGINAAQFVDFYNREVAGTSGIVDKIFGNERINIYLDDDLAFGVVTSDGKIIEENETGIEEPTLNVYIKSEDLQDLINGRLTIEDALRSGKIKYQGAGFFAKVKFGVIHFFQSWFLKAVNTPLCIDSDGPLDANSSYIKGVCTDKDGNKFYDKCELIDPSDTNHNFKQLVDYDCNSEGYCEPVNWYCAVEPDVYECEAGACVACPGAEPGCYPSQINYESLSIPEPPKMTNLSS